MIKLITSKISRFFPQLYLYGFSVAFWTLFFPFLTRLPGSLKYYFAGKKHKSVLLYLYKRYSSILATYENTNADNSAIQADSVIWVCWWDGTNTMPDIVKICYNYLLRNAGTHSVQLITKDNYTNFVSIPKYIMDKVNDKKISITHFSDILRAALLHEYGGIWMDATLLVLNTFSFENLTFYTFKAPVKKGVSITLPRFAGLLNNSIHIKDKNTINISRWSGFLLACKKGSLLFYCIMEILYLYWKDHNDQIDYLLIDYIIALAYDYIPSIKKIIDDVPCSSKDKFLLEKSLNNEFSDGIFNDFTLTPFHKLTWKKKFNTSTSDNKLTFYGHLLASINS